MILYPNTKCRTGDIIQWIFYHFADEYCYYGVRIVTGSQPEAGTDTFADISVTLIGTKARSDGDKLNSWWEILPGDEKEHVNLILECNGSLGPV